MKKVLSFIGGLALLFAVNTEQSNANEFTNRSYGVCVMRFKTLLVGLLAFVCCLISLSNIKVYAQEDSFENFYSNNYNAPLLSAIGSVPYDLIPGNNTGAAGCHLTSTSGYCNVPSIGFSLSTTDGVIIDPINFVTWGPFSNILAGFYGDPNPATASPSGGTNMYAIEPFELSGDGALNYYSDPIYSGSYGYANLSANGNNTQALFNYIENTNALNDLVFSGVDWVVTSSPYTSPIPGANSNLYAAGVLVGTAPALPAQQVPSCASTTGQIAGKHACPVLVTVVNMLPDLYAGSPVGYSASFSNAATVNLPSAGNNETPPESGMEYTVQLSDAPILDSSLKIGMLLGMIADNGQFTEVKVVSHPGVQAFAYPFGSVQPPFKANSVTADTVMYAKIGKAFHVTCFDPTINCVDRFADGGSLFLLDNAHDVGPNFGCRTPVGMLIGHTYNNDRGIAETWSDIIPYVKSQVPALNYGNQHWIGACSGSAVTSLSVPGSYGTTEYDDQTQSAFVMEDAAVLTYFSGLPDTLNNGHPNLLDWRAEVTNGISPSVVVDVTSGYKLSDVCQAFPKTKMVTANGQSLCDTVLTLANGQIYNVYFGVTLLNSPGQNIFNNEIAGSGNSNIIGFASPTNPGFN